MDRRKKIIAFIIVIAMALSALSSVFLGFGKLWLTENKKSNVMDIKLELVFAENNKVLKDYKTEKTNLKDFIEQTGLVEFTQKDNKSYISKVDGKETDINTEKYIIYKNNAQIDDIDNLKSIPLYNNDSIKIENKKLDK